MICALLLSAATVQAANYPLQVIQPQPNLGVTSRYYRAYPGISYRVPIGVFGGAYPFTYSLTTAPAGMTIDPASGIVTWPNPVTAGSPHAVTASVRDDEGVVTTRSWSITVTTQGFLFLDAESGTHAAGFGCTTACGDGTIGNPFRSMLDVYRGTDYDSIRDATYDDYFIYWRAGTYGIEAFVENSGQQFQAEWRGDFKPHVWLAYPGESVTIDHDLLTGTNGVFLDWRDGDSSDAFIHGIRFQDMLNHAFRLNGDRVVMFENAFVNLGPGADGHNTAFVMFSGPTARVEEHALVSHNVFDTLNTGSYIKAYGVYYGVFANNTFRNPSGGPLEGLALKGSDELIDVRANTFDGRFGDGAISGNWADCGDMEIRFNNAFGGNTSYSEGEGYAITINYHGTTLAPVYIHRNTFVGTILYRWGDAVDGPFYLSDNVIVNNDPGNHISHYNVSDASRLILDGNLSGNTADQITDSAGRLQGEYRTDYLGQKGHELSGSSPDTLAPAAPVNLQVF
jgi:hypothetical protein